MIHSLEIKEDSSQSLNKLFSRIKSMHKPELVRYTDVKGIKSQSVYVRRVWHCGGLTVIQINMRTSKYDMHW